MDGLPFPFAAKRRRFELAALVYCAYAAIIWTGALRPFFFAASAKLAPLASAAFGVPLVRAQMNQRRFFASLAAEMLTMMDCAAAATAAWGPGFDLAHLERCELEALMDAEPAACGDADCADDAWTWRALPRSAEELRGGAAPGLSAAEAHAAAVAPMLARHASAGAHACAPLPGAWRGLAVRAMSARCYAFGMGPIGDAFYDREMREWAGAEHALHVLLARAGSRTVFPTRSHGAMFFGLVPFIAGEVVALERDVVGCAAAPPA